MGYNPGLMRGYLYFTAFLSGLTTLALELSAARLLKPQFGDSDLVWASVIGLILIYLAVGYFVGGRWADRSPRAQTMFSILAWGSFTAGLVPLIASPILLAAADAFDQFQMGVLAGAFASVLVLFIVPVTLLGTISPFVIRLAITDPAEAGTISGRVYAVSTLGSFLGSFLPSLVLVPLLGTRLAFIIFAVALLLVALIGLWRFAGLKPMLLHAWMLPLLLLAGWYLAQTPIKQTAGQIFEDESSYNYIQVVEVSGYRILRLNEGQGIHSIYHPDQLEYAGTWDQFLVAPFFNAAPFRRADVTSMALVGLAAGTSARQATAAFGPIPIDGYELDPQIIEVGREYFGMDMPNLNAEAIDGRIGLRRSQRTYDLIGIDAYRPPYIPWQLTTVEFFSLVRERLSETGALAINVGRAPGDRRLIETFVATLEEVFPSVFVMDVPGSFNSIIYATAQPTSWANLETNLTALVQEPDVEPVLVNAIGRALANQQPTPSGGQVLTDDYAPIEWLTHSLILNFVLGGGVENLQ